MEIEIFPNDWRNNEYQKSIQINGLYKLNKCKICIYYT